MSPARPSPPEQTPAQRAANLATARKRRAELAELRRQLRAKELTLTEVFAMVDADRTSVAARARIRPILLSIHGIGAGRADRILTDLRISADRHLVALSPQQRTTILARVSDLTTRPPGAR